MAESICLKCEHKYVCATGKSQPRENTTITGCSRFVERTPFNNADRIRAMGDEELAVLLSDTCYECAESMIKILKAKGIDVEIISVPSESVKILLKWLKSPVE